MIPTSQVFDDPALEEAFQLDFARRWQGYFRVGAVLLPILFGAFALVDLAVADGPTLRAILTVRAGVVTALLGLLPCWFHAGLRALRERHLQRLLLLEAVVALGGLLLIGAIQVRVGGRLWIEVSAVGVLVALSFLYGASRLRFRFAVALGVVVTIGAMAALAASPERDLPLFAFATFYGVATNAVGAFVARTLEGDDREAFLRARELAEARERTERLLHAVLHPDISARMRHTADRTFAEAHGAVTVVLADLVGFTPLCETLPPDALGALLDRVFGAFDELAERHGVLKLKTLGDAWVACAGLPHPRPDHAAVACALAREMVDALARVRSETGRDVSLRIGVASGPVVAGVIGRTRYAYDVWGDAFRAAATMEQSGAVGRVHLDPRTADALPAAQVVRDDGGAWLA